MALDCLTEEEFAKILAGHLRLSVPTDSEELLYGREHALQTIREAYYTPGRHSFITGDRGVGKTSVARTAGFLLNPSTSEPVYVACNHMATFATIIAAIHTQLTGDLAEVTRRTKTSVGVDGFGKEWESERIDGRPIDVLDINSATAILRRDCANSPTRRVIIIDEFERLTSAVDKVLFAELTKQLADTHVNAFVIFGGIGRDVDELLDAHGSSHRYFDTINLPRLDYTARWEIIDGAATALGIRVNDDSRFRIAAISDGFPHYIHLICHKLFWILFHEASPVVLASQDHYVASVRAALTGIEPELRKPYELATMKNKDDYEPILWAISAHFETVRNTDAIYSSYLQIMTTLEKEPLDRRRFSSRLNSLKSDRHGHMLITRRRNWYEFSQNVVRGYVRLRAEDRGLRLPYEHEPQQEPRRLSVQVPAARPLPRSLWPHGRH